MHTIVLDASGDDEDWTALRAAAAASIELDVDLLVIADKPAAWRVLRSLPFDAERLSILDIREDVLAGAPSNNGAQNPTLPGIPSRHELSVATGLHHLAAHPGSTFISTHDYAALVRLAPHFLSYLPTIKQPALAAVYPTLRRHGTRRDPFALLLDVGATARCSDGDLLRFASMGSVYASLITGNERPTVVLLANATHPDRWPKRLRRAHRWLTEAPLPFDYLGPMRADRVTLGEADVIVTDGFTGDILLRTLEGVADTAERLLTEARERFRFRVGFSLLGSGIERLRELTDWQNYGGAPLLGFDRTLIVTHQRSTRRAIFNSIRLARKLYRMDLQSHMLQALDHLAVTRPSDL
jgi:glycerol-3-phosphate acyltransferase PlsX